MKRPLLGATLASLLFVGGCQMHTSRAGESLDPEAFKSYAALFCRAPYCDTPPVLIRGQAPEYPEDALRAGIPGHATVIFYIDENGRVAAAHMQDASALEFGMAVLAAMKTWYFKPAMLNGRPVRTHTVKQTYPFRLPAWYDAG